MSEFKASVQIDLTGTEKLDQFESKLKSITSKPYKVKLDIDKNMLDKLSSEVQKSFNGSGNKSSVNNAAKQAVSNQEKMIKNLSSKIKDDTFSSNLAQMENKLSSYSGQDSAWLTKARNQAKEYGQIVSDLSRHFNDSDSFQLDDKQLQSSFDRIHNSAKGFQNAMKGVALESSKNFDTNRAITNGNKILKYYNDNTKAAKKYGEVLQQLSVRAKSATTDEENALVTSEFNNLKSKISAEGLTGKSFLHNIKNIGEKFGQIFGAGALMEKGISTAKQMVSSVIEVDSAMTDLRKVSNAPDSQIDKYFSSASATAKDLGASVTDVISSTADWSRLGYNLPDSAELARVSTLYKNVGDNISIDDASGSLISTIKGFGLGADDAESVVDKFNEVGNNFAIGSDGLGEALKRSASSLSASGNTLDESIGMITAANTVVQDEAVVGTAFKTMSMRIRGASTDLAEAGLDTDGMAESTAKLREEVMALSGVDIMENDNTFKSTYKVLDDLAGKWTDLSDIQRASVTELIAGKNQGQIMSALMNNWEIAQQATASSVSSQGSAMAEQAKYTESIQYSIDRFKASFQELSAVSIDSGFLKGIVDGGAGALNIVTQLVDKIGILTPLLGGIGISQFMKNFD